MTSLIIITIVIKITIQKTVTPIVITKIDILAYHIHNLAYFVNAGTKTVFAHYQLDDVF
ncbi:MAG: hypothetical protein LBE18_02805 [Planctomycetaceae bacterium]|nr:hypothetical protein [Planctomycetaceae bacterium]